VGGGLGDRAAPVSDVTAQLEVAGAAWCATQIDVLPIRYTHVTFGLPFGIRYRVQRKPHSQIVYGP